MPRFVSKELGLCATALSVLPDDEGSRPILDLRICDCDRALRALTEEQTHAITLHLGNGCSATAIRGGRSVDTSMGMTPLEGLVTGTRSGDIDPAIVNLIATKEGLSAHEVDALLNI